MSDFMSNEEEQCPECGSQDISGLVEAFWAALRPDGSPREPLHRLVESETEIQGKRMCNDCGHEYDIENLP